MTKRINPLDMEPVIPEIKTEQAGIVSGVNSISNIVDTNYCPVCQARMQFIYSNGVPSNVCFSHNVNLPVKD